MSDEQLLKPLEGDALRIQQLTAKLAQVQQDQSFFNPRIPGTQNYAQSSLGKSGGSDASSGAYARANPRSTVNASFGNIINRPSSAEGISPGSSKNARRQAPSIVPAQSKTSVDPRTPGHFKLFSSQATNARSTSTVSPLDQSVPSSEVVPFLYQSVDELKRTGEAEIGSILSPSIESENPFDIPLAPQKSLESLSGQNNHFTTSSPLAPRQNTAIGAPLAPSLSRRDASTSADAFPSVSTPSSTSIPTKQSRGFFNSFRSKKKRDSVVPQSAQVIPANDMSNTMFTSPFESSKEGQPPVRSSLGSSSFSSLRLPHTRRQMSTADNPMQRIKSSIISMDKSPGSSISTGGITLDTDMSRMSGIVNTDDAGRLPRHDFSFSNSRVVSLPPTPADDLMEAAWAAPESWAVRKPEEIARDDAPFDSFDPLEDPQTAERKESHLSNMTTSSDTQIKKGPNHQMRIFRGDWTFATVACGLHTTTESLMAILGRKFFLPSVASYQILLERNGLSRILQASEKPFELQKILLEEAGYTDQDRLEEIGREDNSYLCRFIFTVCSVPSFSLDADSSGAVHEHFDLSGRNIQTVPIVLYKHAGTLRSLDVSRNLSLDIPIDFIQSCPKLQTIVYTHNEVTRLPNNIIHTKSLMVLDVSFNRMTELHSQIDQLSGLVSFIARNNRLSKLPMAMSALVNLRRLNLSSNSFTQFPKEVCHLVNLEDLDLSFNRITSVPESIGNLTKLQRFLLNNNRLLGTLPRAFAKLTVLREVDLRFNHLTTLDVLSYCPLLESISAGHNAVTVVESQFPSARLFHLNKCPVTKFTLQTCGLSLTSLDLSNAKLPSIPDAMFDTLTNLIKLVLDGNHFTYLPPQLGKLTRLQHLSCTSNQLSVLPEELGNLCELRVLDIHSNNLKTIPATIWQLTGLISFNASSNLLTAFPEPPVRLAPKDSVPHIGLSPVVEEHTFTDTSRKNSTASFHARSHHTVAQSLKYLFLGDNRMDEQCFESISLLQELRVLNLSFNELYEIPATGLRRLHHLVELYLSGNELTSLPADDLEAMQTLRVLHVNANKLQTLPAEIGKIRRLLVLDVGSNALKYNTANWPYDWNWNWNLDLKYLNLSGNKRLEIKTNNSTSIRDRNLSDFNALTRLRVLGLMDITLTIDSVPEENENRRVRLSGSDISNMSYGQADTLGRHDHLSTIDLVIPRFQGRDEETIFGMFDGSEIQNGGSKVAKHLQDFFAEHIAVELKRLRKDEDIPTALRRAFLAYNKELGALVTPIPVKKDSEVSSNLLSPPSHRPSVVSQSSNTFAGPYIPVVLGAGDRTAGAAICIVYLVGKRAYVANIGDALAVLSKADGTAKLLSVKHNAGDASEVERIRHAGGYVSRDGLVNDQLDVTRSVGYFHLTPLIQAAPYVETIDLTEEDEFIIIASKSLWEVMSLQTAIDIARSEHEDLMLAAQKLRDFAISYGAPNKISIMIIGVGDLFHRKSKLLKMRNTPTGRNTGGGYAVADDDLLLGHKSRRRANDDQPADSTLARLTREVPPPTGEVAMIFTDIKNSTLLWETHPVAMRSAIKIHNGIMRRQLRSIGGYEVKTEGDAFMVCFPTTTSALLWCFTVQTQLLVADWPQEILESSDGRDIYEEESGELLYRGISVRMGVHWGSPVCEVDPITRRMDYFGPMVNRAARISGVADGGQITISADVVRDLEVLEQLHRQYVENNKDGKAEVTAEEQAMLAVRKDMQMLKRIGFEITPLGERRLKGLENAEFISLAYPKSLRGRLAPVEKVADATDASLSGPRVLDYRHVVDVYAVVFRLENLCSTIRGNKPKTENRVNVLRSLISSAYSKEDDDMRLATVLENLLTRVENAMAALTMHYSKKATNALILHSGLAMEEILEAINVYKGRKENSVTTETV